MYLRLPILGLLPRESLELVSGSFSTDDSTQEAAGAPERDPLKRGPPWLGWALRGHSMELSL